MFKKMVDSVRIFGIIFFVALWVLMAPPLIAQERPVGKKTARKARVVSADKASLKEGETLDEIRIIVRLPKPEVYIFMSEMKFRYKNLKWQKSFLPELKESTKNEPF